MEIVLAICIYSHLYSSLYLSMAAAILLYIVYIYGSVFALEITLYNRNVYCPFTYIILHLNGCSFNFVMVRL